MTYHGSPSPSAVRLTGRVAVCSTDPRSLSQLTALLTRQGHQVDACGSLDELEAALVSGRHDACVIDEPPAVAEVARIRTTVHERGCATQFIVLPALGAAVNHEGSAEAVEVLEPPHTPERIGRALFAAIGRCQQLHANLEVKTPLDGRAWQRLIGHCEAMQAVRAEVHEAVDDDAPVLICGEAGTGATMLAGILHAARCDESAPLLSVRCQVLSAAAAEEALFGAPGESSEGPVGRLQAAVGGTVLIDDIEALALPLQRRLAAWIAGRAASTEADGDQPASPQVVATTHADLPRLVGEGQFDAELLRQLSARTILLPPLRDRREDVAPLAEHFLAEAAAREGRPVQQLSAEALRIVRGHAWPGNVRELENVISRCCTLETGSIITAEVVSTWIESTDEISPDHPGLTLREMERKLIEATFTRFNGNRELTARALKIGLRTLSGKLREYGYPPRGGPGSNRTRRAA